MQKVVAPPAVIVGVAGAAGLFSTTFEIDDTQLEALVKVMLYEPAVKPVIVCGRETVADPAVQFNVPVPEPETKILPLEPPQTVGLEELPMLITGIGLTVTPVAAEVAEHPPLVTVTVGVEVVLTVID